MTLLSVLAVTDDVEILDTLTPTFEILDASIFKHHLQTVPSLKEALEVLRLKEFTLIIVTLHLSDSHGLATFLEIQRLATSTPIILIDELLENATMHAAVHEGAQDYISKSELDARLLAHAIQLAMDRQQLYENLKALSFTDALTGLYNRRGFLTLLDQQMALARRVKKGFYLFLIDFDDLKQINDTYGHLIGDRALIETAECLRESLRQHDVIGRMGGDEFAAIAIAANKDKGEYIQELLLNKLGEYNILLKEPFCLSFSIGKAFFDGIHEVSREELLEAADLDLYQAKKLKPPHINLLD